MATLNVGPNSSFHSIAAAMLAAAPGDTIALEPGYSNEVANVTHTGMIINGNASSTGIVLHLAVGVATVTLAGLAPINVVDSGDGNGIVGNAGNNIITVTNGSDSVDGGLGVDRLVVDYRLATGAVTGDSTSNFAEAGGSRLVTITDGTIENFTILTGSGADTITTGAGDDIINTGEGASTVNAGQGANRITGGSGADTITALDGGNFINGGDGANTLTSGSGNDVILSGVGADTIIAGGGDDRITVRGGADMVDSGAGVDRLTVDYSAFTSAVTGGVTSGLLSSGYVGHIADSVGNSVDFQGTESFAITTGAGADVITTGDGADFLNGGGGANTLRAGGGNDVLSIAATPTLVDGGADIDKLFILSGRNILLDNANFQNIESVAVNDGGRVDMSGVTTAPKSIDSLSVMGGHAAIIGTQGNDHIFAGAGNDAITGGAGNDYIRAGTGHDTFNEMMANFGRDRFADVNLAKDTFEVSTTFAADASHLHFVMSGAADTLVYGDAGRGGEGLLLTGINPLAAHNNAHFTFANG